MSAQSINASKYNHSFQFAGGTGQPPGLPLRDASDYTTRLNQMRLYQDLRGNVAERKVYPVVQSNDVRLDYNFGGLYAGKGCSGCTGGANFLMLTTTY